MIESKIEIIKIGGIVDNHTSRRLFPVIPESGMKDPDDIVEYARKQKVTKIGEGEDDYLISEDVVEVSRVNRQAFIAKDADDVGVLNILEKVRRSGDVTLLNQTGAAIPEDIQDYTGVPSNVGDAVKAVQTGALSFEGLKAIFGDLTFEAMSKLTPEEITSKVQAYISATSGKKEEGGNE